MNNDITKHCIQCAYPKFYMVGIENQILLNKSESVMVLSMWLMSNIIAL